MSSQLATDGLLRCDLYALGMITYDKVPTELTHESLLFSIVYMLYMNHSRDCP